jgi:hypothetical protein
MKTVTAIKTATTIVCIILLSGCTNTIYLKSDDNGGRKCEARAEGMFTTSMANSRFQQCLNP